MMNNRLQKVALLTVLSVGSALATEWRSPWIAEQGPLRYTFEKLKKDKANINVWSATHMKEAHKAFLKHGTDTKELTALIFNKSNFTLNEIFPDSQVPFGVANYSPFLKLLQLNPRASYMEYGLTVGGRIDYPVWSNKGRIGLRASVPFRRIEIEREDVTDKNADPLKDFVATRVDKITRRSPKFNIGGTTVDMLNDGNIGNTPQNNAAQTRTIIGRAAPSGAVAGGFNWGAGADPSDAAIDVMIDNDGQSAGATPNTAGAGNRGTIAAGNAGSITAVQANDYTASQATGILFSVARTNARDMNANVLGSLAHVGTAAAINAAGDRGDRAAPNSQTDIIVSAYRLDYVQSLEGADRKSVIQIPNANTVNIFGNNVTYTPATQKNRASVGVTYGTSPADMEYNGFVSWMPANETRPALGKVGVPDIVALDNQLVGPDNIAVFDTATDYRALVDASGNFTQAATDNAKNLWLTFRRAADSADGERFSREPDGGVGKGSAIARNIQSLSQIYRENPLVFMGRQGFELESQTRSGMGDIDLDAFYEHTFNKDWMGELCVGVRFPTGGDKDQYGNPYKPMLGNGEHFQIKLGGLAAWQPIRWMNVKLDASYSFVLEATEHRIAAFKGAKIKNLGPRADADVDWGYFDGKLDFTFFHTKTNDIRSTFGYELYYKTEDHLTYKKQKMESWLGGQWNQATGVYELNEKDLDSNLARKNTDSISHKARFETSFQVHKYFEIFTGGSIAFAGRNVMRDRDCHGGFNVRF